MKQTERTNRKHPSLKESTRKKSLILISNTRNYFNPIMDEEQERPEWEWLKK